MSDVKYRYKGTGRLYDIPARDLTADEFEALHGVTRRRVIESGLYSEVKDTKPADKPAAKNEKASQKDGEK